MDAREGEGECRGGEGDRTSAEVGIPGTTYFAGTLCGDVKKGVSSGKITLLHPAVNKFQLQCYQDSNNVTAQQLTKLTASSPAG